MLGESYNMEPFKHFEFDKKSPEPSISISEFEFLDDEEGELPF